MLSVRRRIAFLILGFAAAIPAATTLEAAAEKDSPTDAEIQKLVDALSSRSFAERRQASMALIKAGPRVIPAIASAAETNDLETAVRCIEILRTFFNGDDDNAKRAAEQALQDLSKSSHTSVAQRAAEAIKPPEPERPSRTVFINGRPVRVVIQQNRAAVIRRAVRKRRPPAKKPDSTNTAKLETTPDGVTLTLTEKSGKQKRVSTFKAKNEAELKKKFPKAYKVYQAQRAKKQAAKQAIRVNFRAAGGNNKFRFKRVSQVNGKREIEVGNQDRTIKITDENGKNIVVEVTEHKGPKDKKSVYKAADLDELKKKHPDAAKLYQEHAGTDGNAGIRIKIGR